jgi:DNA-binding response OmpR family regulator
LPNAPGLEVCKQLKADPLTAETQIILLSAENDQFDRVAGFELGADDFVITPCHPREMVLRVKAVLRRATGGPERRVHAVGPIVVDHRQCAVFVHGLPIHVTAIEFKILALLAGRPGAVQSRGILLTEVWGDETAIDFRSVDTYLRRLRRKLGGAAGQLRTVRGLGYRLTP